MWNPKQPNSGKQLEWWLPGTGRWGDVGQRVQTFGYNVTKFRNLMHSIVIIFNNSVQYT